MKFISTDPFDKCGMSEPWVAKLIDMLQKWPTRYQILCDNSHNLRSSFSESSHLVLTCRRTWEYKKLFGLVHVEHSRDYLVGRITGSISKYACLVLPKEEDVRSELRTIGEELHKEGYKVDFRELLDQDGKPASIFSTPVRYRY